MVRARTRFVASLVLAALITACGADASPSAPASAGASDAGPSASGGGEAAMISGPLASGVTHTFPGFDGLAVTLPDEGWSAALPNGGDAQISNDNTAVYFIWPATIVSSDGTARRDWPSDPEAAKAQIEAVRGITIDSVEPITVAGADTEILHITANGLNADAPMLQSGSGESGFNDGPNDVVLLPVGDRLLFITYEAGEDQAQDAQVVLDGLSFVD